MTDQDVLILLQVLCATAGYLVLLVLGMVLMDWIRTRTGNGERWVIKDVLVERSTRLLAPLREDGFIHPLDVERVEIIILFCYPDDVPTAIFPFMINGKDLESLCRRLSAAEPKLFVGKHFPRMKRERSDPYLDLRAYLNSCTKVKRSQ